MAKTDLEKMQNVIAGYTDYPDSLVLTADDVGAILSLDDYEHDPECQEIELLDETNYEDLFEELAEITDHNDSEQ